MTVLPDEVELEIAAFEAAADDHFTSEMIMVEQDIERGFIGRARGDVLISALKDEHDRDILAHKAAIMFKYKHLF